MERSDEERRLDGLYNRIYQLGQLDREKDERIKDLEAQLKAKDELLFAYESVKAPRK